MTIEYITLGIYFAVLLSMGALFSRMNKDKSDFIRGGSRGTWWMVGTSITMAGISAFTFTGNGSAAYDGGFSLLIIYMANLLGFAAGAFFLGPWYRQTRAYTSADIIRGRFSTKAEQFSVWFGVCLSPIGSAMQLWALGVFVSSVFGFPLQMTIILVGMIVLFYSVSGGMWAVMATDVVQGIVLYSLTIIAAILALHAIGGIGAFFAFFEKPEFSEMGKFFKEPGAYPDNKFSLQWAIPIFFIQLIGQCVNANRYFTVKDGREATKAAWWAFVLMAIGSAIWFIPPIVARFIYADQVTAMDIPDPATAAYAVAGMNLLPQGLMGIMIAAMFAATMSSMDSGINGQTATIVHNLIGRLREKLGLPELEGKRAVRWCRVTSSILGCVIISFSLLLATQDKVRLFDVGLLIGAVIGGPMVMPFLAGIFIRRLPSWSYFAIIAGGMFPTVYALITQNLMGGETWSVQERGMYILLFSSLATLICIPLARWDTPAFRDKERAFFKRMLTPVDFEKEIGGNNDATQARMVGTTALVIAGLLCFLILLPNPWSGRLIILALASLVGAVGALLLWASKREASRRP